MSAIANLISFIDILCTCESIVSVSKITLSFQLCVCVEDRQRNRDSERNCVCEREGGRQTDRQTDATEHKTWESLVADAQQRNGTLKPCSLEYCLPHYLEWCEQQIIPQFEDVSEPFFFIW